MNYLWIIGGRGQSASANTWCWYFSGCRYKGLVSISGNHLIPDARHCHHFEVRYVRPGNKIFMKIIQMVCCMHNTFHFMRNSTLSVMKDLSKFSSTTWVITIPICTWWVSTIDKEHTVWGGQVQLDHISDHNTHLNLVKNKTNSTSKYS